MAQLMPNGFEEYEIRFSRDREDLYLLHFAPPLRRREPTLGLLACCLFLVGEDSFAVHAGSIVIFGLPVVNVGEYENLLERLSNLHLTTLTVMLSELGDQMRLAGCFEPLLGRD